MSQLRPAEEHIRFDTEWVSPTGGTVSCGGGMSFPTVKLQVGQLDVLMVPGMLHGDLRPLLQGRLDAECQSLRRFAQGHGILASSCSGSFLLAQAGVLDGRRATTSWWLNALFRKHFPAVEIDTDELVLCDGPVLTSGAITAYADLGLWLIGHFGGDALRQMSAKVMAADSNRSSQAP